MTTTLAIAAGIAAAAAVLWPRHGFVSRWRRGRELTARVRREDALKHILKCGAGGRVATLDSIAGSLQIPTATAAALVAELQTRGLLTLEGGGLRLTEAGRDMGLHVVRAHRLWESFLAEQTGIAEREWHQRAEKQEHLLTPQQTAALEARLGYPIHDPHGDAIPGTGGALEGEHELSLNSVALDTPVLIAHLEDEPVAVYSRLVALGVRPGMRAYVIERAAAGVRIWADGADMLLPPVLAENVSVRPIAEFRGQGGGEESALATLGPGRRARVAGLSPACRGPERRRLLDLGFVPGTEVAVDLVSPLGDPVAYRVRGAVVALRREQAGQIRVVAEEGVAA